MLFTRIIRRLKYETGRRFSYFQSLVHDAYGRFSTSQIFISNTPINIEFEILACEDFDVFNCPVGEMKLFDKIDFPWDRDYISGGRWEYSWHRLLPYKKSGLSDIKVPWELGRGHFLPQVAHGIQSGSTSADCLLWYLSSFVNSNPPGYGVQWQCTMDVSIRLVNAIISNSLLLNVDIVEKEELEKYYSRIYISHYLFISKNVEVFAGGFKNNHYLADLMGNAWYYSFIDCNEKKCRDVLDLFSKELEMQFLGDGGNFEGSASYHFLSTEIVILSVAAVARMFRTTGVNYDFSPLMYKIMKLVELSQTLISTSGYPSRIGDDDSGMVIRPYDLSTVSLCERNRYIASNRVKAFCGFLSVMSSDVHDVLSPVVNVLFGLEKDSPLPSLSSGRFADFGLYKYRFNEFELYFRHLKTLGCDGAGGHNHMDDMSFELFYEGFPIIVDPGTYCYTSSASKRNDYRDARAHNGVLVDRSPFYYQEGQKGIFKLFEKKETTSCFKSIEDVDMITTNRSGCVISRKVSYGKQLKVTDELVEGEGEVRLTIFPGLDIDIDNDFFVIGKVVRADLVGVTDVFIEESSYSEFYLNERPTKSIVIKFLGCMSMDFTRVCI